MTDTEMILEQMKGMQEQMKGMQEQMNSMQGRMDGMQVSIDDLRGDMKNFKEEMLDEFQKQTDTLSEKSAEIDRHVYDMEHSLKVYMESAVGTRITTLVEGFEINQEYIDKNRRIARRIQEQVDELETRVAVLESRTSA